MRYMLLIYTTETEMAAVPAEEMTRVALDHRALMEEAGRKNILHGADPLEPTTTATTVRMKDGRPIITDGPFAETREQLAGYYLLECENLDEAIAWAARMPTTCGGATGCVEIRPVRSFSAGMMAQIEAAAARQDDQRE